MRGAAGGIGRLHVLARLAAAVLAAGPLVAGIAGPLASPALAACASPQSVADAVRDGQVVFVGSVVSLSNDDHWAVVNVEERWRGADSLGDAVRVHGSGDPGVVLPTDRTYEPGRYLFVVTDAGTYLADNACSGTQPWTADLARLRPAGVPAVAPGPSGSPLDMLANGDAIVVSGLVVALLIAVVAYILILRRRKRPPNWRR